MYNSDSVNVSALGFSACGKNLVLCEVELSVTQRYHKLGVA